jgi:hypothetical protein
MAINTITTPKAPNSFVLTDMRMEVVSWMTVGGTVRLSAPPIDR